MANTGVDPMSRAVPPRRRPLDELDAALAVAVQRRRQSSRSSPASQLVARFAQQPPGAAKRLDPIAAGRTAHAQGCAIRILWLAATSQSSISADGYDIVDLGRIDLGKERPSR